ncbi:MAG: response regulator, partial [Pseudomonadales bacterium]
PGRGTTFVVEFPIVEVPEPQEDELHQKAAPRSYTMLKVLAVDDEPIVTDLLAQALGGLGHDVDTSDDGAAALRMIHLADYDAIILDVKMPGLGGPEVYRCIEGLRPDLMDRVLFITGDTVSLDTTSFMKEVQADVLLKPFSLDELKRHMEEFAAAKDARVAKRPSGGRPDLGAGLTRITHRGR